MPESASRYLNQMYAPLFFSFLLQSSRSIGAADDRQATRNCTKIEMAVEGISPLRVAAVAGSERGRKERGRCRRNDAPRHKLCRANVVFSAATFQGARQAGAASRAAAIAGVTNGLALGVYSIPAPWTEGTTFKDRHARFARDSCSANAGGA